MNNLIFGEYPYQKFSNTFLTKVLVVFGFEPTAFPEGFDDRMNKFSMEAFGIPGPTDILTKGVRLTSSDGCLFFNFTNNYVSVEILGKSYDSFSNSIIPQAFKLRSFVEDVIKKDTLRYVSIRKLNTWQFEKPKNANAFEEDAIRKFVFSSGFNQLEVNADLSKEEQQIEHFKKHRWEDGNSLLELRTAFLEMSSSNTSKHIYGLVLDSERKEYNPNGIQCVVVDSILKEVNKDLYNAYMWSVSDAIKNIMSTGKEAQ